MRRIFLLALMCLVFGTTVARAGIHFSAKTWRSIQTFQTYDVQSLNKSLDSHRGELVAVRFNCRGTDLHHLKPSWFQGSIWGNQPGEKGKYPHLRVLVSKKDLSAFKSIPTGISSPEITIYGRVGRDAENDFFFVRLIGRKVTFDSAGNATVDW